jgi:hypothetical protein
MRTREIFESSVRPTGDLAGVFEHDGEAGYFYLYGNGENKEVLGALHVLSGPCGFRAEDVEVRWAADGSVVGLFISGRVWAVFDANNRTEYGGDYAAGVGPDLPDRVRGALAVG